MFSLKSCFTLFFNCIQNLVFPPRCPVCDGLLRYGEKRIHPDCVKKLIPANQPVCMKCGRKLYSETQEYCGQCRKKMPPFTQGKALFVYRGAVRYTMYRFKYSNRREYAAFFADQVLDMYASWLTRIRPECIIPVPMYPAKQKSRGYNQAETFARALSERTGIPVEKNALRRVVNTKPLKTMKPGERREALAHAFSVDPSHCGYSRVLLVDDIFTTGNTAGTLSKLLEKAGIQNVYVLTVCTSMAFDDGKAL